MKWVASVGLGALILAACGMAPATDTAVADGAVRDGAVDGAARSPDAFLRRDGFVADDAWVEGASDAATERADACVARTCAAAGAQCGSTGDGCGGTLDCGGCDPAQMCASGRCVARTFENPTHSSEAALADPDTVATLIGDYVTYGTTVGGGQGPRCGAPSGKLYVPFLAHGSGNRVGMSDCYAGDAMPSGPGAWAEPGGSIWAPGVARFGSRYIMYYTASRRGSGQKCIGRATSGRARGPFVDRGEWACPPDGRWVIDANPIVAGDRLFVTWRDDAVTRFPETGISVVQTDDSGRAQWGTRRTLQLSTDVQWDTTRISGTTHVIENPSLFRHDGSWYLAVSGNNWDSPRYATGIARCGSTILPSSRCSPIARGVQRPYFGFMGTGDLGPYRGLPQNRRGPGGMDVFRAANGSLRVVWHWWRPSDGSRHVAVGRLLTNAGGFYVGP